MIEVSVCSDGECGYLAVGLGNLQYPENQKAHLPNHQDINKGIIATKCLPKNQMTRFVRASSSCRYTSHAEWFTD